MALVSSQFMQPSSGTHNNGMSAALTCGAHSCCCRCLGLTCSYSLCAVALRQLQFMELLTCPLALEVRLVLFLSGQLQKRDQAFPYRAPCSHIVQIPSQIMNWQTAAFGGVLVLNLINLATKQHAVRFRANVLLLFINAVAFVTDLVISLDLTPAALTPAGRQ